MIVLKFRRLFIAGVSGAVLTACAPAMRSLPPSGPEPVVVDPTPVTVARTSSAESVTSAALRYGFADDALRARVSTVLRVDSASTFVVDSTVSTANLLLSARSDSGALIRADGMITAFTRTPYARLDPGAPPAVLQQLRFVALRGDTLLRIVAQPPLDNECDREETSALALISELLLPLPTTLTIGNRWTDVTRTFSCRGDVPMTTEWRSRYTVDSISMSPSSEPSIAAITREMEITISGSATSAWPKTELRASGSGRLHYFVRLPDAAPLQMTGEVLLDVVMTSSDRPREPARLSQRTVYHIHARR